MVNELKFDILGTSFTITTDEDEAYLEKILTQYKAAVINTQSISGIKEPLNIAILTGFLLCDEFNKIKYKLEEEREANDSLQKATDNDWEEQEVEERTVRLIAKLEQALNLFSDDKGL